MTAGEYMMENMQGADFQEVESALIGFTTLKCKELLEIVVEKAKASVHFIPGQVARATIDKDSILNAVDLETFII